MDGDSRPGARAGFDVSTLERLSDRLEDLASPVPRAEGLAQAAVLAPLMVHEGRVRLLLTERSSRLRNHAGQISFPGGKPDPEDPDLAFTALREAAEEVDLPPRRATLLGRLPPVPTPTGYLIHPYVARIDGPFEPRIASPAEVAKILLPDVATLADPAVYVDQGTREWRGFRYRMHAFRIADPPLWGATARMVYQLLERMGVEPGQ